MRKSTRIWLISGAAAVSAASAQTPQDQPTPFSQPIKGTALSIAMVPVAPLPGGSQIWMSRTEIPWEVLDVCVYGFDKKDGVSDPPAADAVTRPTKPYIATDRGFGHAGWPANSISFANAKAFCVWISAKTGRPYRLPTVAEWTLTCEGAKVTPASTADHAWFDDTSEGTTHKVGSKKPDAQGLCDLYGNLSEWCVEPDGTGSVMGGSYRDGKNEIGCAAIEEDTPNWNMSDPQLPRSQWWLADAGWIGFRIVCDGPAPASAPAPAPEPAPAPAPEPAPAPPVTKE
ncbi:MAG: hypothetical protein EXS03_02045 [Phycisphaerales bacterium]|nr:hypothetical protein [Phycisphaerales bacterium]